MIAQNKTQSKKVIFPIKIANIRKKVVYAPYLIKFVDYIIKITGTKSVEHPGLKEKAKQLPGWQERGDKPERAGLLFPANVRHTPSFQLSRGGNNRHVTRVTSRNNKGIFMVTSTKTDTKISTEIGTRTNTTTGNGIST